MTLDMSAYLAATERELQALLSAPEPAVAFLYQMMQYHMGWSDAHLRPVAASRGKRLRPLLCLLACEAVSGHWEPALPAAAAIELVHNFSLLHDDIEDNSDTRRGRRTVWSLWGVAQGLNTGDAMWAIARLAVHGLSARGHTADTVLCVSRRLDEACLALCTGQYLDLAFENMDSVSLSEYQRMISGKTAALLSASLGVGAMVGGAGQAVVEAYTACGYELGLTFQISDDILGIWGDPTVTGKPAASDILNKKKTLPVLHALAWEQQHGYADLARIYAQAQIVQDDVPAMLVLLDRAGALAYARGEEQAHLQRTLAYLAATGVTHPAQDALKSVVLSLAGRDT